MGQDDGRLAVVGGGSRIGRMDLHQVMAAVDSGLRQARDELNARRTDGEPEYDYGLIVCANRISRLSAATVGHSAQASST